MNMIKQEKIKSITDIGLCLKTLIKNRYNKNTKLIYTDGRYKSLFISFYKNYSWQFYVQDKNGYFLVYLLKNDKVIKREMILRGEIMTNFYNKVSYFFKFI